MIGYQVSYTFKLCIFSQQIISLVTMENVHLEMDIYKMSSRQHNSQMFAAGP